MRLEELWRTVEQIPHAILKLEFAASGHHSEHFLWHYAAERQDVEQHTRKDTLSISGREARSCMCGGRRAAARRHLQGASCPQFARLHGVAALAARPHEPPDRRRAPKSCARRTLIFTVNDTV